MITTFWFIIVLQPVVLTSSSATVPSNGTAGADFFRTKHLIMNDLTNSLNPSPDLYITRDEPEIIDALVDHKVMPRVFEQDTIITFFEGTDYHLVIYYATDSDRGFQMFVVRDFAIKPEALYALYRVFSQFADEGLNRNTFRSAASKIDNLLRMSGTFRTMIYGEDLE